MLNTMTGHSAQKHTAENAAVFARLATLLGGVATLTVQGIRRLWNIVFSLLPKLLVNNPISGFTTALPSMVGFPDMGGLRQFGMIRMDDAPFGNSSNGFGLDTLGRER